MAALPEFIETRFPALDGWVYNVDPSYGVGVAITGRGAREHRNLPSPYPRRKITVRIPEDKQADIELVKKWFHVMRERLIGFRVKDPTDFLSIDIGSEGIIDAKTVADCSATDQPLEEIDSTVGWQLVKDYTVEIDATTSLTQRLPIVKPVEGTILVANELEQVQSSDLWRIDYSRGTLQALDGFSGTPYTWGGQFDLPMRFNSTLPIDVVDFRMAEAIFELIEFPRGDFP